MSLTEFRDFGYLQEVNRKILHPLGLALGVSMRPDPLEPEHYIADMQHDGSVDLFVLDARDDPEGFVFTDGPDPDKIERVIQELARRTPERSARLGFLVQRPGQLPPPPPEAK